MNWAELPTYIDLPLTGARVDLGGCLDHGGHRSALTVVIPWLYLALVFVMILGTSNAVNLTDGLDGLAAGTVTIVMLAYAGIAFTQDNLEVALLAAAIAGACVGFLWYNAYPADIFMGDTGSLGLGAAIAALAIVTKTELLLVLIGGIYVAETLSVILQVASFKLTGKRIFLMAPLHHHFEMKGWSETKVMVRFWIITGIIGRRWVRTVLRESGAQLMKSLSDILIVGLGISGEATARYFLALPEAERPERRHRIAMAETRRSLRERAEGLGALGADVRLGTESLAESVRPRRHQPGRRAGHTALLSRRETPPRRPSARSSSPTGCAHAPWVAVTGTNGKTTVTSLIAHLLRSAGMVAEAVGNIGVPAIEVRS